MLQVQLDMSGTFTKKTHPLLLPQAHLDMSWTVAKNTPVFVTTNCWTRTISKKHLFCHFMHSCTCLELSLKMLAFLSTNTHFCCYKILDIYWMVAKKYLLLLLQAQLKTSLAVALKNIHCCCYKQLDISQNVAKKYPLLLLQAQLDMSWTVIKKTSCFVSTNTYFVATNTCFCRYKKLDISYTVTKKTPLLLPQV